MRSKNGDIDELPTLTWGSSSQIRAKRAIRQLEICSIDLPWGDYRRPIESRGVLWELQTSCM